MHARTDSALDPADLEDLKESLVRLRRENEADVAQAREALETLTADNSIGSASLQEVAGNAEYTIADALSIIALIDAALDRMAKGEYGTCVTCKQPIPLARLQLRPYGTTCVPCSA